MFYYSIKMYEYKGIKIHWLGHDAFLIEAKGLNIYLDPYKLAKKDLPPADIIITSHEHFDHCSLDDIGKIANENTVLIGPKICQDTLKIKVPVKKEVLELNPNEEIEVKDIKISAIPAYNTHRFRAPGQPFHPKESGHIGPIINIDGIKIYHAGDTDKIDEMKGLEPDIALIPVSGTYVMDVDEAVEAAKDINAKITIPMHVGRGIGKLSYTEDFKNKVEGLEVVILELEE